MCVSIVGSSALYNLSGTQDDGGSSCWNIAILSPGFQSCLSRGKKTGVSCKMFIRPKAVGGLRHFYQHPIGQTQTFVKGTMVYMSSFVP